MIAGGKCRRFTTIGIMESVLGNSITMALLMEVEACRYLNERKTHKIYSIDKCSKQMRA